MNQQFQRAVSSSATLSKEVLVGKKTIPIDAICLLTMKIWNHNGQHSGAEQACDDCLVAAALNRIRN